MRSKEATSKIRYHLLKTAGRGERELVATAKSLGLPVEPQVPVGPWFVDLVVRYGPVAVAIEVDGSEHVKKSRTKKDQERTKQILREMCLFRVSVSDALCRPRWCLVEAAKSSNAGSWLRKTLEAHLDQVKCLVDSLPNNDYIP